MSAIITKPYVSKFPTMFPYCCAGCTAVENSNRKFYVDLGFNEFEYGQGAGRIYLCNICLVNFTGDLQAIIDEKNLTLGDIRFPNGLQSIIDTAEDGISRTSDVPDEPESTVDDSSTGTDESVEYESIVVSTTGLQLNPIHPTRD